MKAFFVECPLRLRLLLISPFVLLLVSASVLAFSAVGASGAAKEVRYADAVPVYAGLLASTPSVLFGFAAGFIVWRQTSRRVRIEPRGLVWGLVPVALAIGLLLTYANYVGDPEHYKGQFNAFTQQWDPRFHPTAYMALTLGISIIIPMGAFGVLAKLVYIDAIQPAKLDRPEGFDPIGIMLRTRGPEA